MSPSRPSDSEEAPDDVAEPEGSGDAVREPSSADANAAVEPPAANALSRMPEVFARAMAAQGFSELTPVQEAVLDSRLSGRDLRISSQTGSGKTVALGFVVSNALLDEDGKRKKGAPSGPRVLMIAPTRELAAQLGRELSWLYGGVRPGIAVVTGGTAVGGDVRALAARPEIVVGTPGRLVDLIERGVLSVAGLEAVVLDEADEMLDMGFREELENILDRTPERRRTIMASATFRASVDQLANRYQTDAIMVEGTVGSSHQDISHSAVLVETRHRMDTMVNLLLLHRDQRVLVFVRTRVAAAGIAGELNALGFSVSALSGEMAQRERARCLAEFRAHRLQCVVATDVASRGLDIRGVQQIVHYDLPESHEAFTHRSGRTGRAGDKGESTILVPPRSRQRIERLFRQAKVKAKWKSPPTPAIIRKANRKRLLRKFGAWKSEHDPRETGPPELRELAAKLLDQRPALDLVTELLQEVGVDGPTQPRTIPEARSSRASKAHSGSEQGERRGPRRGGPRGGGDGRFVPFHVSWGSKHGANPKNMLAHVCRRGRITGSQVGAIKIHDFRSVVDIAIETAEAFEKATAKKDPRNPKVRIQRFIPHDQRPPPKKFGKKQSKGRK